MGKNYEKVFSKISEFEDLVSKAVTEAQQEIIDDLSKKPLSPTRHNIENGTSTFVSKCEDYGAVEFTIDTVDVIEYYLQLCIENPKTVKSKKILKKVRNIVSGYDGE